MRDLGSLTARQILSITEPESLFSFCQVTARKEYRQLIRLWHPDSSGNRTDSGPVINHLAALYRQAIAQRKAGNWREPLDKVESEVAGRRRFLLADGSIREFEYVRFRPFEGGRMLIAEHAVCFEIDREFEDLYRQAVKRILDLGFADREMAAQIGPCLPEILDSFVARTGPGLVLIVRKTPDQLLLADVLEHFGGSITPVEHLGWIMNVLYNIACYLKWSGITHNAIATDTLFVSPMRHTGMLLGGWWYSAPVQERLLALPSRCLDFAPPDILASKRADIRLDLESIKAVGRELLGDRSGARLHFDSGLIPEALRAWLLCPTTGGAESDYFTFKHEVLTECFGAPRFVEMSLDSRALYREG
ncbi:MAG: hypothetical protein IPM23_21040 [Candidatus Melainabacteria bacterium]|nr:hypothetical protein [Candidatus Melainabacteria bacterium]